MRRILEVIVRVFTAPRASVLCLAVAVLGAFASWSFQSSAAGALEGARNFQDKEVSESGSSPPSVRQYREILDTLERSISIRRTIDGRLADAEDVVAELRRRQSGARTAAERSHTELIKIARTLGGAVKAARASFTRLDDLKGRLGTSARLAERIAEELEELDHKLGPTVARR
jgi:DNA repair exonuclease SbcCD ATPase subunit